MGLGLWVRVIGLGLITGIEIEWGVITATEVYVRYGYTVPVLTQILT